MLKKVNESQAIHSQISLGTGFACNQYADMQPIAFLNNSLSFPVEFDAIHYKINLKK